MSYLTRNRVLNPGWSLIEQTTNRVRPMRTWVSMYTRVSNKTNKRLTELMIKFNWYLL